MSNLTSVTLTSGVPSAGSGTVSTLDNLIGTAGTPSDQVQSVQGHSSMTPVKVDPAGQVDFGSGTGGSKTQRVIIDSSQAAGLGQTTMSASTPVVIASDQSAVTVRESVKYVTVAASQTDQVLQASSGAAGDYLAGLLIVPATTAAGTVSIKDGSGSAINVFVSGTLSNLVPFFVPIGAKSTGGAWKVTTGANVSVIATGIFS